MDFNLKVSGDAAGGWIAEIHDGELFQTFSPEAPNVAQAAFLALMQYAPMIQLPVPDRVAAVATDMSKTEADLGMALALAGGAAVSSQPVATDEQKPPA